MLSAADLHFAYRRQPVLRGVTFSAPERGLVGILGPNGSGKTTLLKLLSGVLAPDSGVVSLDGRSVASIPSRDRARRLAVVPQETRLAFDYTVTEIVLMGRYPHLSAFEIEGPVDLDIADEAMRATGVSQLAARAFETLSGGEKQRVIIASALAQLATPQGSAAEPSSRFLLLDEPTASLDLRYQVEVAALVGRLHAAGRMTVLVSTHDLQFAATVCSEVILLKDGVIAAQGPPRTVLTPEAIETVYEIDRALAAPLLPR